MGRSMSSRNCRPSACVRRTSLTSQESNSKCIKFYCCPCTGLCYLFCLKSMKVNTRLKIVWIWIISLSLLVGLYLRLNMYENNTQTISSSDMLQVQKISTAFCEKVKIETTSPNVFISVYLLPYKPEQNSTFTKYSFMQEFTLNWRENKTYQFYLMTGSLASISVCTRKSTLTLYLIKSMENMEKFVPKWDCKYCIGYVKVLRKSCSSKIFEISSTDRYFFFIINNWEASTVSVNMTLKRKSYRVNEKKVQVFSMTEKCIVPVRFWSTDTVVYQLVSRKYTEASVTTTCEPQNVVYVSLFLAGPFLLGLGICYIIKQVCESNRDVQRSATEEIGNSSRSGTRSRRNASPNRPSSRPPTPYPEDESFSWLSGGHSTQHESALAPPSYESLFAPGSNVDPPSYQTALTMPTV